MLNFADATASAAHPFVGLRPFTFEDSAFFFGREQQIAAIEERVSLGRLVSVVGSSGSGKSSLVRAGVLPMLSAGNVGGTEWDWVEMRPGESPVRNLAEALARPNHTAGAEALSPLDDARADRVDLVLHQSSFGIGNALSLLKRPEGRRLLILVDQFEEIFRFADLRTQRNRNALRAAEQRDEATFFIQLLLSAIADTTLPACIMITMRSDFIGECARFHGLSEAVTETQYLVPALTRDQRAAAIRGPINLAGAHCDPALVQRLLNDSSDDPDQLPVMQHTVMRCWQRATHRAGPAGTAEITLDDYKAVGGFEGALAQHGDELLAALDTPEAAMPSVGLQLTNLAKRVFQTLTEVDSHGRVIRRPQGLSDLVAVVAPDDDPAQYAAFDDAVRRVVLHFSDPACSFLRAPLERDLVADSIIDIGHEALIRRWERLGGLDTESWVRDEQSDAETYRNLLLYSQDGGLIPRGQLRRIDEWLTTRRPTRFWARRYTRGGADRLADVTAVISRSRAQVIHDKRVKRIAIAAGVVGLIVIGFGVQYIALERLAEQAAQAKHLQEAQAITQARLVAVEGVDELRTRSSYQALLLAISGLSDTSDLPIVPESQALAYEALSRLHERSIFCVAPRTAPPVAFMPDGAFVTYAGNGLQFWNADTGQHDTERDVSGPPIPWAFSLMPDMSGRYVLMNSQDQVFLFNLKNPNSHQPITLADGPLTRLGQGTLSMDGKMIATAGRNASPKLWALSTSEAGEPTAIKIHDFSDNPLLIQTATSIAISPDSKLLAIGSENGNIEVFTIDGLNLRVQLVYPVKPGPQEASASVHAVFGLVFDPSNPTRLLANYQGSPPQIWNLETAEGRTLPMGTAGFNRGAFSADGRYVAVIAGDARVVVWDMQTQNSASMLHRSWELRGSDGPFFTVGFDGKGHLATGSANGTIWLWDLDPALTRGLPTSSKAPVAQRPAQETATTMSTDSGGIVVRSSLPGVSSRTLTLPNDLIKLPVSTSVSADGKWGLISPDSGPILLFDLREPGSPTAAFGEADERWSGAVFANNPDRIIGTRKTGGEQSWRFFDERARLLDFALASLPLENGKKASLTEEMKQKIAGNFWTVMSGLRRGGNDGSCGGRG